MRIIAKGFAAVAGFAYPKNWLWRYRARFTGRRRPS